MFCKNCGNQIDPQAAICVKCGFANGVGNNFCHNCGRQIAPGAAVCMGCGVPVNVPVNPPYPPGPGPGPYPPQPAVVGDKSKMTAGLLGIFLGGWGVHNFYLGKAGRGAAQLVVTIATCGMGSLWGFIEGIMILSGSINTDGNGNLLKD